MSADIVIPVSVLVVLFYIVWRINRTKKTTKNNANIPLSNSVSNLAPKINQFSQTSAVDNSDELNQEKHEYKVPADFLDFKLIPSENLDDEQQKAVTIISQSFRKPHPLLLPLTQSSFEPSELFDLIKTDAEMTAKILNAVNSPLFALRQPITNINHAIIFLGITQVKNIALQFAVQSNMEFRDKAQNDAYNKLWKASYLASAFCLLFAKEMGEDNAAELSTHCLLSYLGDLAILSYQPSVAVFYLDDYTLYERTKVFQNTIGTNAAVVGKYLAQQWQLPQSIESGIDYSILPLTNGTVDKDLSSEQLRHILICYLSCRLGDLVAFGDVRDISTVGEVSFEALGEVDFYYTQENIKRTGLDKINAVIADATFRKKINKVIEQTSA
ncbi:MAG: HDOD domain-containing protein [Colwellia sp.]|nr:HDOD domain-containing protein [Colwellia sp.]